jgi:SAM-dependent methyltransferase
MAELMLNRMNKQGRIYALEIGAEMKEQLFQRQINDTRLLIIHQRIDEPFQLSVKTTFAFISFVLHGLNQDQRLQVMENVYQNLQDGGKFCILDYNYFSVEDAPWYVRFAIRRIECAPTEDFIIRDWPFLLVEKGFSNISLRQYVKGYVRLLCCCKQ